MTELDESEDEYDSDEDEDEKGSLTAAPMAGPAGTAQFQVWTHRRLDLSSRETNTTRFETHTDSARPGTLSTRLVSRGPPQRRAISTPAEATTGAVKEQLERIVGAVDEPGESVGPRPGSESKQTLALRDQAPNSVKAVRDCLGSDWFRTNFHAITLLLTCPDTTHLQFQFRKAKAEGMVAAGEVKNEMTPKGTGGNRYLRTWRRCTGRWRRG